MLQNIRVTSKEFHTWGLQAKNFILSSETPGYIPDQNFCKGHNNYELILKAVINTIYCTAQHN